MMIDKIKPSSFFEHNILFSCKRKFYVDSSTFRIVLFTEHNLFCGLKYLSAMGINNLSDFNTMFHPFFSVAIPVICVVGVFVNCLNIMVLTRRGMKSPTNVLLIWLATVDGLAMACLLGHRGALYFMDEFAMESLSLVLVHYVALLVSLLLHSIAIWLAVTLGVFRTLVIYFPFHANKLCTISKVNITSIIVCVVSVVISIPYWCTNTIESFTVGNSTMYFVDIPSSKRCLFNISCIVLAISNRILTCLLLLVLNVLLIRGMYVARRHRKQFSSSAARGVAATTTASISATSSGGLNSRNSSDNQSRNSTGLLVVVVALSLVTETPQGILLLWGCLDNSFLNTVYAPLGDIMETLALLNSSINFIIYCTMSGKFRKTFVTLVTNMFESGHRARTKRTES